MRHLAGSAALLLLGSAISARAENVSWTNVVGVSVSGSSLTKTGVALAWDAGAASKQVIRDGYGYVDFIATETTTDRICGLSQGDSGQGYAEIDYAIFLQPSGLGAIYESGTGTGVSFTYAANDRFRVEVSHGQVRYLKNGTVLRTSNVLPSYPLRVDTSLYTPGATLTDVKVGNLVWAAGVGVRAEDGSLTKTGAAGWNSGAFSSNFVTRADGFAEFTAGQNATSRIAGLGSLNPSQIPQALADIEFGIHLRADGLVTVREGGVSQGDFGGYVGSDRFRVEIRGTTVRYLKNGAEFLSHAVTPTYPLRLEAAFETAGATLQDLLLEEFVWSSEVGVAESGATLTKTSATGWNASAASSSTFSSGDAWMEFTAIETNTRRAAGLNSGSPAVTYSDIDFAIELTDTGTVRVLESGVLKWDQGGYAHGDRLRVEVREGVVRYLRNGTLLYTSLAAPTYPLRADAAFYANGASLVDAAQGNVVWTGMVGVQQRGVVLRKLSGGAGYDAGAVSTRAVNSGFVEATATDAATTRVFGLSHGDLGTPYADIDYAVMLTGGSAQIWEKGAYRTATGYAAGDRFRVEVASGQVKYYRNGGAAFYTSAATPALPLRVDTSFGEIGSNLLGIVLSGAAVQDQLEAPVFTPAAGTYTSAQSIAIVAYPGATVRFTTNGSTPTTSSPVYSAPVPVNVSLTLKAKAWKSGFTDSPVATGVYTLQVAEPQITPAAGAYDVPKTATITCSVAGAVIHYTTGSAPADPTEADPAIASGGTLAVNVSQTIKAKAWKTGWTPSTVASAAYTLKVATPTLIPTPLPGSVNVQVSTISPGATLHYSTTGAEPTTGDPTVVSGGTVAVASSTTLKVKGVRAGWTDSDTAAGSFLITGGTVAAPTMNPAGGTYTQAQSVTLSTTTSGALIRYTVDGTDPGFRSPFYASALSVDSSTTIKAKAFRQDWTPSAITTAAYTINTGAVDAPQLSPGTGTYTTHKLVTVTCATSGATIRFTTDGRAPTEADPAIASGAQIDIPRSLRLRARAFKAGLNPSPVRTADYRLQGAVAAGGGHSLALKADGTVWGWGESYAGNLGNGANTHQTTPVQASGLVDAVAIAAGGQHSLAIDKNGQVWGWGAAGPNGSSVDRWVPTAVAGAGSGFVAVSAGNSLSLALKNDGTVWIWGSFAGRDYGYQPVQVTEISGVSAISSRYGHSLVVKTDGTTSGPLWAWGTNDFGQLGDGTTTPRLTPVRVANVSDAVAVGAGFQHSLTATAGASVLAWGANFAGQLGDGTLIGPRLTPGSISGLTATSVAAFSHSLAVGSEGRAYGWGWNPNGQVGNGIYEASGAQARTTPDLVAAGNLLSASGGNYHSVGLRGDGRVWSWGSNLNGRLGVGATPTASAFPLLVNLQLVDNTWLTGDADGDGLTNDAEVGLGTDPVNADTNGDGLLDGAAVSSGMSATNLDMDGDGVPNTTERQNGTDPFLADTDGDGVSDLTDAFPLDPTRWAPPAPTPGDVTPPVITLLEPKNAVPVP